MSTLPPRQRARYLRASVAMGILGGVIMTAFGILIRTPLEKSEQYDLLLRRSMQDYPDVLAYGWFPLDWLLIAIVIGFLSYSMMTIHVAELTTHREHAVWAFKAMLVMGFVFMSIPMTMSKGWYIGLEAGIAGSIIFASVMAGVVVLFFAIQGFVWVASSAYEAYLQWWLEPWLHQHFSWIGRFFRAEDIPEEKS